MLLNNFTLLRRLRTALTTNQPTVSQRAKRLRVKRALGHEQLEGRRVLTLPLTLLTAEADTVMINSPTGNVVNDTLSLNAFINTGSDIDSYYFAPQFSGSYTIDVGDFNNSVDPEVAVYVASTGVRIGYNDDVSFLVDDARLTLSLLADVRYIVAVADETGTNTGELSLKIQGSSNTVVSGTTLNSFGDAVLTVNLDVNTDIDLYQIVAPEDATGALQVSFSGATFTPRVALFNAAGDMISNPGASLSNFAIVPNEVYRLSVYSANYASSGTATMIINFTDTTAVVTNTADSGPGSLRQAMLDANAHLNEGTPDTIRFNIPGAGPHTIALASALPNITESVIIDASTQPFATPGFPSVAIDGGALVGNIDGLRILASNTTIKQLNVRRFPNDGVEVQANNVLLESLTVGSDWTVDVAAGNANYGIRIAGVSNTVFACNSVANGLGGLIITGDASDNNLIVGSGFGMARNGTDAIPNNGHGILIVDADATRIQQNYASGNASAGIALTGSATSTVIVGNFIGVSLLGTAALPNAGDGVLIQSPGNRIGGPGAGERNVISGNGKSGITISGLAALGNTIEGNLIGTDPTGTFAIPNSGNGIRVLNAGNTRIGSETEATGANLISGNGSSGITFSQSGSAGGRVFGNKIGTTVSGMAPLGNAGHGVLINANASGIIVGGSTALAGNLISANGASGITLAVNSGGNEVQGNLIGTNSNASGPLGNGTSGITVQSTKNRIGGPDPRFGNTIGGNANGISLTGAAATLNVISFNNIGTLVAPNISRGVQFSTGASGNVVGPENSIVKNETGVRVNDGSIRNRIVQNSFFENTNAGIDLYPGAGINPQDPGDADGGGNLRQNSPTINGSPLKIGDDLEANFSVDSAPANAAYPLNVEFYLSDGSGEGLRFLADTVYTLVDVTAGSKTVSFVGAAIGLVAGASRIVALATDANGNTSEFSAERVLADPAVAASLRQGVQQNGNRLDVNDDGVVSPLDVLNVISALKSVSVRTSEGDLNRSMVNKFFDTNGDGQLSPLDVLLVINGLRRPSVSSSVPAIEDEKEESTIWDEAILETSLELGSSELTQP